MTQKQKRIYQTAYALLERHTPLRADCGALCGGACCKGDSETGMLLFPGEQTPLFVAEQNGRRLAVCGGQCRRAQRPLSCRLFPFLPLPGPDGRISVVIDSRGYGVCPLARHPDKAVFSRRFLHRVRRVGALLCRDRGCRAFLEDVRRELDEYEALRARLSVK